MQMVYSEPTKEKERAMLRFRLISLALASSLALSGCCTTCESGSMFPRLSERFSARPAMMESADCDCQRSAWPQGMPMPTGQGPFLMPGSASNPPVPTITTVPTTQPPPPAMFRVPPAPPTAYSPTN